MNREVIENHVLLSSSDWPRQGMGEGGGAGLNEKGATFTHGHFETG